MYREDNEIESTMLLILQKQYFTWVITTGVGQQKASS